MKNKTLAEIIREKPEAVELFEGMGMDYCCHGNRSLELACWEDHVSLVKVLENLHSLHSEKEEVSTQKSMETLVNDIVNKHHTYVRDRVPKLSALLSKIDRVHGNKHPELSGIRRVFDNLGKDLLLHLDQEEKELFPVISHINYWKSDLKDDENALALRAMIRDMNTEHQDVGDAFKEIHRLGADYRLPEDACASYRLCFQWMKEFESDLHTHIHLENNVLFPQVIAKLNHAS